MLRGIGVGSSEDEDVVGQMAGASPGYERDVLAGFRTLIDTLIDTGRASTRTGAPS